MSKVRLAIIGNGMVGHRFIEDLLDKSDAANFDITVFCEEPRIAYDRVHLSSYFSHHTAEELSLVREGFYEKHGIKVLVGERAITINRQEKVIHSSAGRTVFYDKLIMATGSYPWIPPIKGSDTQDCFVYRTIEDLNAIESCARRSKRGAVVGGGLLGLEAAGALKNLGIETHVIEFAPMLMAEQLDQMGGEQLRRKIESMGVHVHTSKNTLEIVQEGVEARKTSVLPTAASWKSTLSSSQPVSVRAISWQPSVVWTLLRVGVLSLMIPARLPIRISTPSVNAQAGTTVYLVW